MNSLYKHIQANDGELIKVIRERIKWDKRVSLADLDIQTRGDKVIVTGYVDTSYKKNAVIEVISDTEGVWGLEDRIIVPSDYYRSDEEILKILKVQIDNIIKVGGEHVEVEVNDGVVRLTGEAFRPRLKAMAVACAWELSGVKDVLNFIEITDPPSLISTHLGFETLESKPLLKGDLSNEKF